MRPDLLGDLAMFEMIASEGNFTRAAKRLGVTQSALSQALKRVEEQLGVRLLARTTRSVFPTEAGSRLLAKLSPALKGVSAGLEELESLRDEPAGLIRVTAGKHAADTVLWPALVPFMREHSGIDVEVSVESGFVDIVANRFDAGIRLGEQLENDMVALPIGPRQRVAVVAAPRYLAQNTIPNSPTDLAQHRCIAFSDSSGDIAAWEFERNGHRLSLRPKRGLVLNDGELLISAAIEGFGLLYILEGLALRALAEGKLSRVLEDWCEPFAGYHLYYSSRRHHTKAFMLFKDALRHSSLSPAFLAK